MDRDLIINGQILPLHLKISSRSRRLRITLHRRGGVTLTRPQTISEKKAYEFLREKIGWIAKHLEKNSKRTYLIPRYSKKEFEDSRGQVLTKVISRLNFFNKHYGFSYGKVSIRNTQTRWGSCSSKKNLQFSFKLNYIPDHLFDYVIVHELCHLKEFNHASSFWKLVEETLPNFKELRKELRSIA